MSEPITAEELRAWREAADNFGDILFLPVAREAVPRLLEEYTRVKSDRDGGIDTMDALDVAATQHFEAIGRPLRNAVWGEAMGELPNELKRLREENERLKKVAEIKDRHSLANNLCPDHRDKQQDKACLACENERLRRLCLKHEGERDRAEQAERWLLEIGKLIGCEHIDDRLPRCVKEELSALARIRQELREYVEELRRMDLKEAAAHLTEILG